MIQYFAIINSTERIQLFAWDAGSFYGTSQLDFATNDLSYLHNVLKNITDIRIVDSQNNEIAFLTEYDTYSSAVYMGYNYSTQLEDFAHELIVTLTKANLIEQVKRLDEQVNKKIDFDSMTLEDYKQWKIDKFSEMGEQLIFGGTEVTLLNGVVKNFTYNMEDQSNLLNAIFIIQALGDLSISIPYHGHGEPCELYNARDILAVYFTLQFFSTRIQTEVNMRLNWIRACETKEEAMAIDFDTPLPTEWAERAEAIMGPTMELAAQLQAQYFGDVEPIVEENAEENTEGTESTEGGNE